MICQMQKLLMVMEKEKKNVDKCKVDDEVVGIIKDEKDLKIEKYYYRFGIIRSLRKVIECEIREVVIVSFRVFCINKVCGIILFEMKVNLLNDQD